MLKLPIKLFFTYRLFLSYLVKKHSYQLWNFRTATSLVVKKFVWKIDLLGRIWINGFSKMTANWDSPASLVLRVWLTTDPPFIKRNCYCTFMFCGGHFLFCLPDYIWFSFKPVMCYVFSKWHVLFPILQKKTTSFKWNLEQKARLPKHQTWSSGTFVKMNRK